MPVVDGGIVPGIPLTRIAEGSAAGIALLIGTNREEFRLFLVPTGVAGALSPDVLPLLAARHGWPPEAIGAYAANRPEAAPGDIACAILSDAAFRAPSIRLAAAHHAAGGTVHVYEFGWATPLSGLGACHALELVFVFDTIAGDVAGAGTPQQLADEVHRAWVAFGRTGDPGWRP